MYFDNIIGQDFAKKYLTNSIKKNKINHAYMFEGIDGIGKKKLSQELSKILLDTENVENSPDYISRWKQYKDCTNKKVTNRYNSKTS